MAKKAYIYAFDPLGIGQKGLPFENPYLPAHRPPRERRGLQDAGQNAIGVQSPAMRRTR